MEAKNKPPELSSAGGEKEKKPDNLLKIKINSFLINYFNHLAFALAIIIFAFGLLLFVYPNYRQINQANRAASENLRIEYEKKLNYLASIINLKESYQLIGPEDADKIKAMVPSGSDISGIISEMESVALKNGAILNSVKISPEGAGAAAKIDSAAGKKTEAPAGAFNKLPPGVSRIKTEISLGSVNYPVLKNIIKTFEENLRLFDIAKIDYNSTDNKAALIVYSYYIQ